MSVFLRQPVAVRRATFWARCRSAHPVSHRLGVQMGAQYEKMDLPMAL